MFSLLNFLTPIIGVERVHFLAVHTLRILGKVPGARWFMRKLYAAQHPSLERDVFGIHFRNPIGMAAGFDRSGDIFRELDALGFGFVELGTITPQPQKGNPKPRIFKLPEDKAIINRVGLCNDGLDKVVANMRHKNENIIIGCNIGKNSATAAENAPYDYLRVFRNLYQYADYFTVNVSYNTTSKQYVPRTRESIISILEPLFDFRRGQNQYRPILLKISPDLTNEEIDMMTDIMVDTPLDGIVATNGTIRHTGLATAPETLKRYGAGAVSGSPLTKRAIEVVRRVYERSNGTYPIIGVGGIMTPADAKAMLNAGATLVQVYTGYVYNGPNFVGDICQSLIENK